MKRRLAPDEFASLMAYDSIEPFGEQRADLRMALQTAAIVSALTGKAQRPADFMPKFGRWGRVQTEEEMKAVLALIPGERTDGHGYR